jgi:hypothetical protein
MGAIPSDDIVIHSCGECDCCDVPSATGKFHGGSFYIEMRVDAAHFRVWDDQGDVEGPNVAKLLYPYPPDYNDKSRRSSAILLIILGRIIVEYDTYMENRQKSKRGMN